MRTPGPQTEILQSLSNIPYRVLSPDELGLAHVMHTEGLIFMLRSGDEMVASITFQGRKALSRES